MSRNLDIAGLRSFLTVVDTGGVTRASVQLNLTQSAVSLQIKRLEETFGKPLFDRRGRGVALTAHGEQLVAYARRLLAVNDETWDRMTATAVAGEIHLGVPDDLLYPRVPEVMRSFGMSHPQVKVQLHSAQSVELKDGLARGTLDVILTTEAGIDAGGEILSREPLVWIGAPGGRAWRRRPLPIGTVEGCMFNRPIIETLDAAGFDWALAIDSATTPAVEASIVADIVVRVQMQSTARSQFEVIEHGGALPPLPDFLINMYVTPGARRRLAEPLAALLRGAYAEEGRVAAE